MKATPVFAIVACVVSLGCQQKMAVQPGPRPFHESPFFADRRSERPLIPGTVARGHLYVDASLFLGRRSQSEPMEYVSTTEYGTEAAMPSTLAWSDQTDDFVDTFPIPISEAVLEHGYHRYMIFCVECHDALGTGQGKIVERGYTPPPSYHIERLRKVPVGHLYAVVSQGYGSMPSYGPQIRPRDRWAIVAYIRALQLSQHFPREEAIKLQRELAQPAIRSTAAGGRTP
jgi:mono/diheme cytochrome c family protein